MQRRQLTCGFGKSKVVLGALGIAALLSVQSVSFGQCPGRGGGAGGMGGSMNAMSMGGGGGRGMMMGGGSRMGGGMGQRGMGQGGMGMLSMGMMAGGQGFSNVQTSPLGQQLHQRQMQNQQAAGAQFAQRQAMQVRAAAAQQQRTAAYRQARMQNAVGKKSKPDKTNANSTQPSAVTGNRFAS